MKRLISIKVLMFVVMFLVILFSLNVMSFEKGGGMGGKKTKKLIFIHHSVGGHWLAHGYGNLAAELNKHGIYVNDITYGWQPSWVNESFVNRVMGKAYRMMNMTPSGAMGIGERTDIGHLYDWFIGPDSKEIMRSVYNENNESTTFGDHNNSIPNPGVDIENQIVMIKPCYPNSLYRGDDGDAPATVGDKPSRNFNADSQDHTVGNVKRIYNDILGYFKTRPDKFFVIISAPPRQELPNNGKVARDLSNWLVHGWLKENNYVNKNVMVFDLFNVLTSGPDWKTNDLGSAEGNHHRIWDGKEQHLVQFENHTLIYSRDGNNNHPSPAGLKKATSEFVPLLMIQYSRWKADNETKN